MSKQSLTGLHLVSLCLMHVVRYAKLRADFSFPWEAGSVFIVDGGLLVRPASSEGFQRAMGIPNNSQKLFTS